MVEFIKPKEELKDALRYLKSSGSYLADPDSNIPIKERQEDYKKLLIDGEGNQNAVTYARIYAPQAIGINGYIYDSPNMFGISISERVGFGDFSFMKDTEQYDIIHNLANVVFNIDFYDEILSSDAFLERVLGEGISKYQYIKEWVKDIYKPYYLMPDAEDKNNLLILNSSQLRELSLKNPQNESLAVAAKACFLKESVNNKNVDINYSIWDKKDKIEGLIESDRERIEKNKQEKKELNEEIARINTRIANLNEGIKNVSFGTKVGEFLGTNTVRAGKRIEIEDLDERLEEKKKKLKGVEKDQKYAESQLARDELFREISIATREECEKLIRKHAEAEIPEEIRSNPKYEPLLNTLIEKLVYSDRRRSIFEAKHSLVPLMNANDLDTYTKPFIDSSLTFSKVPYIIDKFFKTYNENSQKSYFRTFIDVSRDMLGIERNFDDEHIMKKNLTCFPYNARECIDKIDSMVDEARKTEKLDEYISKIGVIWGALCATDPFEEKSRETADILLQTMLAERGIIVGPLYQDEKSYMTLLYGDYYCRDKFLAPQYINQRISERMLAFVKENGKDLTGQNRLGNERREEESKIDHVYTDPDTAGGVGGGGPGGIFR